LLSRPISIFDAFNYGERSPFAIRDFLNRFHLHDPGKLRGVLFVGDASLDPRNYLGFGVFDFVPTRIIETPALKTASDDWFSDFKESGFATIPTGRLSLRGNCLPHGSGFFVVRSYRGIDSPIRQCPRLLKMTAIGLCVGCQAQSASLIFGRARLESDSTQAAGSGYAARAEKPRGASIFATLTLFVALDSGRLLHPATISSDWPADGSFFRGRTPRHRSLIFRSSATGC
jgi:hypothetical protein